MKRLLLLVAAAFPLYAAEPVAVSISQGPGSLVKVEQAVSAIRDGAQVLDVRPKPEWDKGHVPRSTPLSLSDESFCEKAKAVLDPARPVLIYCRSGRCTPKAAKMLREAGFTRVDELDGGIEAWEKAGQPVER